MRMQADIIDVERRLHRSAVRSGCLRGGLVAAAIWGWAGQVDAGGTAVTATIENNVLTVTGTGQADAITLRLQAGNPNVFELDVGADGAADFRFERAHFTSIVVDAGGGDDQVVVQPSNDVFTDTERTTLNGEDGQDVLLGANGGETLNGGVGDDTLLGGNGADLLDGDQGDDSLSGDDGDDVLQWDSGDASDAFDGGDGVDRLAFNGSATNEVFDVAAGAAGRVVVSRNVGGVVADVDAIETLDLLLLAGGDTVTGERPAGTDLANVRVQLAMFGGAVADGSADWVIVNATPGDDVIDVENDGFEIVVGGLAPAIRIANADSTLDLLSINGLDGADVIPASPASGSLMRLSLLP